MFPPVEHVAEMPLERLEAELLATAARSTAAMAAWLTVVEEFDRRQGYESWEVPSTASWLAWKCGVDHRTARDYVRVARALPSLPQTAEAFSSGELPYCKVRALTRIATGDSEAELLHMARLMTTTQLERVVRVTRRGVVNAMEDENGEDDDDDAAARDRAADDQWLVDVTYNDEGRFKLRVDAPAKDGALFEAALAEQHDLMVKEWKSGSREPDGEWLYPRQVDAFTALCKAAMSHTKTARGIDDDRYLAVVHLQADGGGYLDGGPRLPRSILEEIVCGQRHQLLIEDRRHNPLYLGRTSRDASRRQRRALGIRAHNRCEAPGCGNKRFLHAHHVFWWINGGPTDIDNLILVCSRHHRLIHQARLHVRPVGVGEFQWTRPDGTVLTDGHGQTAIDADTIPQATATAPVGGTGEPMDADQAVMGVLCTVLGRAPR